jgi:hypothetical protein
VGEIISKSVGGIIPERRAASAGIGTLCVWAITALAQVEKSKQRCRWREAKEEWARARSLSGNHVSRT